jgi:large-conductance mechanosensitive channel
MLKTLSAPTLSTTAIAFYAAAIKFLIVALSLAFILVSALTGLIKKKAGH